VTEHEMQLTANIARDRAWHTLSQVYDLADKRMPRINLNRRLKTTAGNCQLLLRVVNLSVEIFEHNPQGIVSEIVPHEVAHMVAYDVFGDTAHGEGWQSVMFALGLEPVVLHSYHTPRMRARAAKKGFSYV
jgi:predicted SprT family Zn-dependent metalloprotease